MISSINIATFLNNLTMLNVNKNEELLNKISKYQFHLKTSEQTFRLKNDLLVTKIKTLVFNHVILSLQRRISQEIDPIRRQILSDDLLANLEHLISYEFEFEDNIPYSSVFLFFDQLFDDYTPDLIS